MQTTTIASEGYVPRFTYVWPGVAALLLAILFPAYWLYAITASGADLQQVFYDNFMQFDASDLLYLALGPLEIFVYLSFKRILHDYLNLKSLDFLLILLACNAALFYIGLFGVEAMVHGMPGLATPAVANMLMLASWFVSLGCSFAYGLLTVLVAVVLLSHWTQLTVLLRTFALVFLFCGLFEMTFVFGFLAIALFPVSMLLLAAYFIKPPASIELV